MTHARFFIETGKTTLGRTDEVKEDVIHYVPFNSVTSTPANRNTNNETFDIS